MLKPEQFFINCLLRCTRWADFFLACSKGYQAPGAQKYTYRVAPEVGIGCGAGFVIAALVIVLLHFIVGIFARISLTI